MSFLVSLPTDDGFLRRECPACEQEFKWFDGQTEDAPEDADVPSVYFCPYCGAPAPVDNWYTQEQVEYIKIQLAGPAVDGIVDSLSDIARKLNRIRGPIGLNLSVKGDRPESPIPILEPHDLTIVASPCHSYEPIKISDDWAHPIHCLVCGELFVLPPVPPNQD
jgi:hypothetical protein